MEDINLFKYVKMDCLEEVGRLLRLGASPNIRDEDGCTPLHHVGSNRMARLLINAGADPMARTDDGNTPLHLVSVAEAVEVLIRSGADPNAENSLKCKPLQNYIGGGGSMEPYYDVIRVLIEVGADVHVLDDAGENLLFNAQGEGWTNYLIQVGVDPRHRNDLGRTPLHSLVDTGAIRALLAAGGDPTALDNWGETPLFNKGINEVEVLLAAGTDPTVVNREGDTAVESLLTMHEHAAAHLIARAIRAKQEKAHLQSSLPPSIPSDEAVAGHRGRL